MANFNNIKQEIDQNVNTNGQQAITGAILNRTLKDMIDEVDEKKQDTLVAGSGISIVNDVISATGSASGDYYAGEGINIDSENVISTDFDEVQEKLVDGENIRTINGEPLLGSGNIEIQGTNYSAGNGISIDAGEVISVEPGEIAGTGLDTEIDEHGESRLKVDYNSVQTKLESGVNIKTVNGNSLLGSGDLVISGGNQLWQSGSGTNSLLAPASSAAGATASGNGALNAGNGSSTATGELSTAFGHDSKANGRYSFVAGNNSTAAGDASVALGRSLNTKSEGEVAVGKYNSSHTYSSAAPWTTKFSVGNGTSAINTSNSFEIRDNDKVMVKGIGGYAGSGNDSTSNSLQEVVNGKQDILVSGVNIKTINGSSVLGSGDLVISGGSALSAGDGIDIDSNDAINAKLGNGLQLDGNNNIEIDPSVVATHTDLGNYLGLGGGTLQAFVLDQDTELKVLDSYGEDYVNIIAPDTPGEAPHIEIFENGSGDTKFFYDHLERGSQVSINYPTDSGTIALTDDIPTPGAGLQVSAGNEIYVDTTQIQEKLVAGSNIQINGNVISATGGGGGGGLSAGTGIFIANNTINVDTYGLSGDGIDNTNDEFNVKTGAGLGFDNNGAVASTTFVNDSGYGSIKAVNATSAGTEGLAAGHQSSAGNYGVALGWIADASGSYSTAIGCSNTALGDRATALGSYSDANGLDSISLGYNTVSNGDHETSLGLFNKSYSGNNDNSVDTVFEIGNGTNSTTGRKNVLEIKKNNDTYLYGVGGFDGTNSAAAQTLQDVINNSSSSYSAGNGIDITSGVISVDASDLDGNGLTVDGNGALAVDTTTIQGKLTAGANIQINGNTISATDTNTTYSAGSGLSLNGTTFSVNTNDIQEKLVSGTNIKTVNGNSLLGSGNIVISGGSALGAGQGIDIDSNDDINVKIEQGGGLDFNASDELCVIPADIVAPLTGVAAVDLNTDDPTNPYLDVSYGVLAGSLAGSGLQVDSTDGTTLEVDFSSLASSLAGNGLQDDGNGALEIDSTTIASDLSGYFLPIQGGTLSDDSGSTTTELIVDSPSSYATAALTSTDIGTGGSPESISKLTLSDYDSSSNTHTATYETTGIGVGGNFKLNFPTGRTGSDTIATLSDIQGGGSSYSAGSGISIDANNVISNTAPSPWTLVGSTNIIGPNALSPSSADNQLVFGQNAATRKPGQTFGFNGAIALGNNSQAAGNNAVAIGTSAITASMGALCLGNHAMTGSNSLTSAHYATALGYYATATNANEIGIGKYNNSINSGTTAENTQFTVGNGTGINARSNLIEAKQNNDIYVVGVGGFDGTNAGQSGVETLQDAIANAGGGTTYTAGSGLSLNGTTFSVDTTTIQEKLTAGSGISISGNTISATGGGGGGSCLWTNGTGTDSLVAPGTVSSSLSQDPAAGDGAISCGYDTNSDGDYAFACGGASSASGDYSFAANNGNAYGEYSAAFSGSGAHGMNSFAAGGGSIAGPDYSVALAGGQVIIDEETDPQNPINAQFGVAIGEGSIVNGEYGTAIGGGVASGEGSIAIGSGSTSDGLYDVAVAGGNSRGNYSFAASSGQTDSQGHYASALSGGYATGESSLASGQDTNAYGYSSIALGLGVNTYDQADGSDRLDTNAGEVALGRYNYSEGGIIFSIGCGYYDTEGDQEVRENAVAIDSSGNIFIKGLGGYTGQTISGATSLQDFLNNL